MKTKLDWKEQLLESAKNNINMLHNNINQTKSSFFGLIKSENWTSKASCLKAEIVDEAAKLAREAHTHGNKKIESFQTVVIWLEKLAQKEKQKFK